MNFIVFIIIKDHLGAVFGLYQPCLLICDRRLDRAATNLGHGAVGDWNGARDVLDLCDRVKLMNKGRNVGAFKIEDVNKDDIPSLIIKGTLPDSWAPRGQN